MLLIWGFKVRFSKVGEGTFHCPGCGADRTYVQKRARRWFTLFFVIPLIPLKVLGEVIECQTCRKQFNAGVLALPTTSALGEMLTTATRVVTAVVVRAGVPGDGGLRSAAITSIRTSGLPYDEAMLDADLGVIDPAQVPAYLHPLADALEPSGRERFLADLVRVAAAGATTTDEQRALFGTVGQALGLSPAHTAGVVASATDTSGAFGPPAAPEDRPGL